MSSKIGFYCAMLAVFALSGGHWATLQTVANARMLYEYAQRSGSIATAVAETFDGQHPCELCRRIAAEKSQEQKDQSGLPNLKQDVKAKAVLADPALRPRKRFAGKMAIPPDASLLKSLPADQPPTPPPRDADFAV